MGTSEISDMGCSSFSTTELQANIVRQCRVLSQAMIGGKACLIQYFPDEESVSVLVNIPFQMIELHCL